MMMLIKSRSKRFMPHTIVVMSTNIAHKYSVCCIYTVRNSNASSVSVGRVLVTCHDGRGQHKKHARTTTQKHDDERTGRPYDVLS